MFVVYVIMNNFEHHYPFSLFFQAFEDLSKLMVKVQNAFLCMDHITMNII